MDFLQAKFHPVLFGPHRDQPIDTVAMTSSGLLHLDWMLGALETELKKENKAKRRMPPNREAMLEALRAYMTDSTIAKDLAACQAGDGD